MSNAGDSRREFLADASRLALVAGAVGGVSTGVAAGSEQPAGVAGSRKRIIGGSSSPAYSRAVELDRLVFVAGCVGVRTEKGSTTIDPDFRRQAEQTLRNLIDSVRAAGSSPAQVLQCTCFLKNVEDFKTFNEVYIKVFDREPPARSTVIVKDLVVPGALLEVDCVCYSDRASDG